MTLELSRDDWKRLDEIADQFRSVLVGLRRDDPASRQKILSDLEAALDFLIVEEGKPDGTSIFTDGRYTVQRFDCGCIGVGLVLGRLRRTCADGDHANG